MKGNFLDKLLQTDKEEGILDFILFYEKKGWRHQEDPNPNSYLARAISPSGEIWTGTKIKEYVQKKGKLEGDSLDAHAFLKSYHNYKRRALKKGRNLGLN